MNPLLKICLDHACPNCGAPKGERCTKVKGMRGRSLSGIFYTCYERFMLHRAKILDTTATALLWKRHTNSPYFTATCNHARCPLCPGHIRQHGTKTPCRCPCHKKKKPPEIEMDPNL